MSTAEFHTPIAAGSEKNYFKMEQWTDYRDTRQRFRMRVCLLEDTDGGYTIYCPDLSGVISEGDDVDSAIEHFKEAFSGCFEGYQDSGERVPWTETKEKAPEGALERWITVDV